MVLLKGFGPGRVPLLHQPRVGEGEAARGGTAGRARRLLARARPPGAGPRAGRGAARRGLGRVLRDPPARLADRGVGVAPERAAAGPRGARRARAARPRRGSPAARSRARPSGAASLVRPEEIEFWQGQAARLHDRFRYRRDGRGLAARAAGAVGSPSSGLGAGSEDGREGLTATCISLATCRERAKASSSSRSSKWSSARIPRRAERTRTPVPSADSSASSARTRAASWSGWGTTLDGACRRPPWRGARSRAPTSRARPPRGRVTPGSPRRGPGGSPARDPR